MAPAPWISLSVHCCKLLHVHVPVPRSLLPSPSPATGKIPRLHSFSLPKNLRFLTGPARINGLFQQTPFISLFMEMSISGQSFTSLLGFPHHSAEQDPALTAEDEP